VTVSVSEPGTGVLLLRAIAIAFGGSRLRKTLPANPQYCDDYNEFMGRFGAWLLKRKGRWPHDEDDCVNWTKPERKYYRTRVEPALNRLRRKWQVSDLPSQVEARLRTHLQKHEGKSELLFVNRNARAFLANKLREKQLHPLLEKLGIPRGGFHSMRFSAKEFCESG
jgi:hypothetical protein